MEDEKGDEKETGESPSISPAGGEEVIGDL